MTVLLSNGIPPLAAPIAAQTAPAPAQARGAEVSPHGQAVLASQSAAIVTIAAGAKGRAASSGSARRVDGTFEKESSKSDDSANKKKGATSKTLDVKA